MNEQPDLFSVSYADVVAENGGRSRASDPRTSKDAARGVKAGTQRAAILVALSSALNGLNGYEAQQRCGILRMHGATTRLEELEALGLAHRDGTERPTDSTHMAGVFFVTEQGRTVAADIARSAA